MGRLKLRAKAFLGVFLAVVVSACSASVTGIDSPASYYNTCDGTSVAGQYLCSDYYKNDAYSVTGLDTACSAAGMSWTSTQCTTTDACGSCDLRTSAVGNSGSITYYFEGAGVEATLQESCSGTWTDLSGTCTFQNLE